MLRWIMKTMGQGLAAMIPIAATVGVVLFCGVWLERLLANPFKHIFPDAGEVYRMGMGVLSFLVILFFCGLLVKLWLVRKLIGWIEGWFLQLPLVKTIFAAFKDIMQFVSGGSGKKGDMVVAITLENGWRQLGIVTRQEFDDLPPELLGDNTGMYAVFVPFSYQLGGFTYFIERSKCEPVPGISVEEAMRYAVMAWLGSNATPVPGTPPAVVGQKRVTTTVDQPSEKK